MTCSNAPDPALLMSAACHFLQTVQHFCCSRKQKCCTVCRKLLQSADGTALLAPHVAEIGVNQWGFCAGGPSKSGPVIWDFTPTKSPILWWDFLWKSYESAVLSAHACNFLQTVQHFCHSGQQACCTVCTLKQFSADSTALLLPRVAKVLYCLQKMACMRRQYSTCATPKCKK